LGRTELSRVVEIDRTERINVLYDQHGTQLVARHGNWSASAWDPEGHGEHSVEAHVHALQHYLDNGGVALGAFASGRLVGIGVVVPHLRPGIAQLAFLHVSAPFRARGIGSRLSEQLEQIARDEAIGAVRDGGRAYSIVLQSSPPQLERGITGESFAAHGGRRRLEELAQLVDAGKLRPQVEAVLPLDHAREALARVASRHTRSKIVLEIGE